MLHFLKHIHSEKRVCAEMYAFLHTKCFNTRPVCRCCRLDREQGAERRTKRLHLFYVNIIIHYDTIPQHIHPHRELYDKEIRHFVLPFVHAVG